ncbi:MAG: hypothetical protein R3359_09045 [Marinirhabdus sp.]|nr:hypothetical protein [Marinirhabdus sp.]
MTTQHTIHTARLNNNCPTCYKKDGLEFTFTQEKTSTNFYEKAGKSVDSSLYCHSCNSAIFPVNWTEDIERVYEYHYKMAQPMSTSTKIKPLGYLLIIIPIALVAAVIYYFLVL